MAPIKFGHEVTWAQFETCNTNTREAFEKLCRWLFNDFFFAGKALLHSDPNNPGVEVLPVFHSDSNKRISFQSKYFDSMDYEQIKESARKVVKYYSGKLDVVYLYCNKDVTVTSKGYQGVVDILRPVGIELIPITNQEILEQVMKNETICWHFFDQIVLSQQWLQDQLDTSLALLGPRYNSDFNVLTQTEELFEYFLCNDDAVNRINCNKNELISNLIKDKYRYLCCTKEYQDIVKALQALQDVSAENILDSLTWGETIASSCSAALSSIDALIKTREEELTNTDVAEAREKVSRIVNDLDSLGYLIRVPKYVMPKKHPQILMKNQILVVRGNAGAGKSQMLAVAAEKLVRSNRGAILLLGTSYINDHVLSTQTSEILGTDLSLEALLHKLEGLAQQSGTHSYLFIDAINESVYKSVWQTGLHLLFAKMPLFPHVKLVVSVRTGYEKLVFNDSINRAISDGTIANIVHNGFREESIKATLTFLNHYGIPFLPSYFLQAEMTNPLFLTLFCKTYSGENFSMFSLFDKLIDKADFEAQKAVGITDCIPILGDLIDEMASIRLQTNSLTIKRTELFDFSFWNRYGLSFKKIPYIASLERSGLLIGMIHDDDESYYLGYNLLEDFVCAKAIIKQYKEKEKLVPYLLNDLLKVENGFIKNHYNIDIFIVVCGLFAEKYHKECFEDIAQHIFNEVDNDDISRRYLESFIWRTAVSVDADAFLHFLRKHPVDKDVVFRMLIENSTKEHHPLNSLFLHDLLVNKKIADRDAQWTDFINHLAAEDERIFQLITYFDQGNLLDGLSSSNAELLLILLGWLLTSSNRFLRDKASKAAIELLKHEFTLCKPLLQRFENVNDPYVIQRLYGIIFGACMKRTQENKVAFKGLAEYVFASVFDQEFVYPDILLRDYARLILERWRYEYPNDSEFIVPEQIKPPYKSHPIPVVEQQQYYDREAGNSGFESIEFSMRIDHRDCPGMYGDFGRYTFQATLNSFENVDILNLYHYAMQFIRDELGYSKLLGDQDSLSRYYRYSRHDTKKVERIGKKYQWIAFYNILARISDHYRIKKWDEPSQIYEGPWEPYVRDFDPTLNKNFISSSDVPTFNVTEDLHDFLPQSPSPKTNDIQCWTQAKPEHFASIPHKLVKQDIDGHEWVLLYLYDESYSKPLVFDDHSIGIANGTQKVWLIAEAYFVKPCHIDVIMEHIKSKCFASDRFPEAADVYQLFNREYVWSPGYKSIFTHDWIGYEIETGKYRIETDIIEMPDFEQMSVDSNGNVTLPMVEKKIERKIPEDVLNVEIMPAVSRVLWEEQYDASQDETTSFYIPCGGLIDHLQLEQKNTDGYFYSKNGELVCFDGSLSGLCKGLFIRADYLNKHLHDQDVRLIWTCIGEKQYFLGNHDQQWSNWKGCFSYESNEAHGEFERYERDL